MFVVNILCLTTTGFCQKRLSLGNVYSQLHKISSRKVNVVKTIYATDFDFKTLMPRDTISGPAKDYYSIGYDQRGQVSIIEHREDTFRIQSFRLEVYRFEGLLFFKCMERHNDKYIYFPFFIVREDSNNSKSYFLINYVKQFGPESEMSYILEDYDPGDIDKISAIVLLSDEFLPKINFRVSQRRIVFASEMMYKDKYLDSETLHILNIPDFKNNHLLTLSSSFELDKLETMLDSGYTFVCTVQPSIREEVRRVPIWFFGGHYFYR